MHGASSGLLASEECKQEGKPAPMAPRALGVLAQSAPLVPRIEQDIPLQTPLRWLDPWGQGLQPVTGAVSTSQEVFAAASAVGQEAPPSPWVPPVPG